MNSWTPPPGLKKGTLDLTTVGANAAAVIMAVERALRRAGNPHEVVHAVKSEMRAGDYDHLLQVATQVVGTEEAEERPAGREVAALGPRPLSPEGATATPCLADGPRGRQHLTKDGYRLAVQGHVQGGYTSRWVEPGKPTPFGYRDAFTKTEVAALTVRKVPEAEAAPPSRRPVENLRAIVLVSPYQGLTLRLPLIEARGPWTARLIGLFQVYPHVPDTAGIHVWEGSYVPNMAKKKPIETVMTFQGSWRKLSRIEAQRLAANSFPFDGDPMRKAYALSFPEG